MHKPFEHTLTPDDRLQFSKWLMGVSVSYGAATLILIVLLLITQNPEPDIMTGMPLP